MEIVKIRKINEAFMKIEADQGVMRDISEHFTFFADNYKFMQRYKIGMWDGKIRLLNLLTGKIYVGLLPRVLEVCKSLNYKVVFDDVNDFTPNSITKSDLEAWVKTLNLPFNPRDYQFKSLHDMVNRKRMVVLSPTGSGKSLIIYMFIRWFLSEYPNEKLMLVVPNVHLVNQMYHDFEDYSSKNLWNVEKYCKKIYSGQDKSFESSIIITTWQSVYKLKPTKFTPFKAVISDECHLAKATSLIAILEKMKNAEYRFGTTGTLDDINLNELTLCGLFGDVKRHVTTKTLIENKHLSSFRIKYITLKYPDDECKVVCKMDYNDEINYILDHEKRNKFLKNLCKHLTGNTLILYTYVEKHGSVLSDILSDIEDKETFFIHGGVNPTLREEIRKDVESKDNCLIVASYGTFSTGVNIKNLHNVIFASPTKSKVRSLQSIGRGLRLGENKDGCILFDICDDFCVKRKSNYMVKHGNERLKIYYKENFDIEMVNVKFTGNK